MRTISLIFRRLKKNKTANLIGISGLIAGLVCSMFIFLWVINEIQFDQFHDKGDRIFIVHAYLEGGKEKVNFDGCPPAVAPTMEEEYPEIIETCRYLPPFIQYLVRFGDKKFKEKTAFSEFELFDIFSLPFIYGNKGEKGDPNRIILTEKTSKKYFGNANPVGKVLKVDNRLDMTVVGVIEDIPRNSYFDFEVVIPVENIGYYYSRDDFLTSWYNNSYRTFGLLNNKASFEKITSSITNRIQQELPNSTNYLRAFKFEDNYLYEQNNIRNVRIFSLIAFLVLLAAALNFINLTTARSSKQAKETGLRKTIGASRRNIVKLIYYDIAFISFVALVLSLLIVFLGLPLFNNIIGAEIKFSILFTRIPLLCIGGIYLFTVFLSGSYPAFYLSSFSPNKILSSNYQSTTKRGVLRNAMVVVVFIVSIIMISSTLIITRQTRFLQDMDLGFEREHLMYIPLEGKLKEKTTALKDEISRSPGILSTSFVSDLPMLIGNNGENWNWQGKDPNFKPCVTNWSVDYHMLETFGAKMSEGDFYKKDQSGIVINKAFADLIGWDSYQGKIINGYGTDYTVLGILDDIHFGNLSEEVKPMAIYQIKPEDNEANFLIMRVDSKNIKSILDHIMSTCQNLEPDFPVEYGFFNDRYNQLLKTEINLGKLIGIFSVFAILVLSLGIFGLVLFLAEQKIKEIGIRKCLGESVTSICARFIKPIVFSGLIASVIGMPLTWYVMSQWLQNYAKRIELNVWVFILAGFFTIVIAILTVFWQSWKAATRNPVEALKYE